MSIQQSALSFVEILAPIREPLEKVEHLIFENLESEVSLLTEIGRYIFKSGGKRIRPALLLLSAGAVGKISHEACMAANIIEYLHTASLLHDDVVDNADLRRSKKSARTVWGNEAAVLVGDYLFGFAFKYLGTLGKPRLIEILSDTATIMARGELKQLSRDYSTATEEDYLDIIYHKTASLMGASMLIGGIMGGADSNQQEALSQCGTMIGMAFQLVDDALDYDIENIELGKQQGTDLKEKKVTLPLSHLLENAADSEKEEILDILAADVVSDRNVVRVCQLIDQYRSYDYTIMRAREYAQNAKEILKSISENEFHTGIDKLSDFIVYRKK
ncbi:MAG: polyprenyl synthetase family protein [Proteobacteria bacterium]|nr:polyprenyl synthetase family protein [Pseudomonadota bacterium]